MAKVYNYNGMTGCIEQHKSRQTGKVVSIYRNDQAGLDDCDGEYPYSTVCEEHGWIVAHQTLQLARLHAADPLGWCEKCNGQVCEKCGRDKGIAGFGCQCDDEPETPQAPTPEPTPESSYAQVQRQRKRTAKGRYARMNTCEGCGKHIGDDYYSHILPTSGAGLVLCGKCCKRLGDLPETNEAEAEKLLRYSPFLSHEFCNSH